MSVFKLNKGKIEYQKVEIKSCDDKLKDCKNKDEENSPKTMNSGFNHNSDKMIIVEKLEFIEKIK